MERHKIHPRVLSAGDLPKPNNYFYRLFSSQRFLALVGLIFLLLIVFPLAKAYTQKKIVENEINDVKKQISDFEQSNSDMKDMISYLQSDQSLEDQARLNLNLKKPGEEVVVIENAASSSSFVEQNKTTEQENNFAKWWLYFSS
ncbi:MAG: septum formation initiator family protein [Patescibacteria group bacterium]